jgi:hypothetical protein
MKIMRMRFTDSPCAGHRARVLKVRDEYSLQKVSDADLASLGDPVATFSSEDYVLSINPETGAIEVYERSRTEHCTTDRMTIADINQRNTNFWRKR